MRREALGSREALDKALEKRSPDDSSLPAVVCALVIIAMMVAYFLIY